VAILCASATTADAQSFRNWRGSMGLRMDANYSRVDSPELTGGTEDIVLAGFSLRAFGSKAPIGYLGGVDMHFGGGIQGGFAYEASLSLLGVGVQVGHWLTFGAIIGAGVDGVTQNIDFAVQFPAEVMIDLALGKRVHLAAWGTGKWLTSSDARQDGSENISAFDEVRAGVALRVGKGFRDGQQGWGNGYFIGAQYGERLGTTYVGAIFGFGINMSFQG
jgi:hypothetical protein